MASIQGKTYAGFLFDMDGTLMNSTAAAERVWGRWAEAHGLDARTFLPTMHGVRAVDTIRRLGLDVDPQAEADKITRAEIDDVEGIVALPGALEFLAGLPRDKWAIVTSSPLELAKRRLAAAGIPVPDVQVTAEDVEVGKPNPDCYLIGAARLGVPASRCLVFEDAVPGILAGDAAGADVLVITATHQHPIETAHPTIRDYEGVRAETGEDGALSVLEFA
ncbi:MULTISPECIES: HAD family hydrolase [unclassified Phyllobacterium]|uniref:HAD family hydrolase n=1 Tax=unclassified Phyllobacterium TaxID=2638441 RepID=UPI002B27409A|nr:MULTISPECIES: HAD family hydrolase [unclassified Phyllobacterium]